MPSSDVEMKGHQGPDSAFDPVRNDLLKSGGFNMTSEEDQNTISEKRLPTVHNSSISRSLFALSSIKDSPAYVSAVRKERYILIFLLVVVVLFGPLMFRFCLGAQTHPDDSTYNSSWGEGIDRWEWFLLVAIFINMAGFIVRLLPAICGKPATIESVKNCSLEGSAVLCVCSPFCSEDDILLIRNLLGRTCTLFATVNGRHDIAGLYLDATLNERRLKGEANRKNIFLQWLVFLTTLIKLCQKKVDREQQQQDQQQHLKQQQQAARRKSSMAFKEPAVGTEKSRFNTWAKYGQSVYEVGSVGVDGSDGSTFNRVVVMDKENEVRVRRSTICVDMQLSQVDQPTQGTGDVEDSLQTVIETPPSVGIVDTEPGDRCMQEILDNLEIEADDIEPVVSFLAHWLRELKKSEQVNAYGDKAL